MSQMQSLVSLCWYQNVKLAEMLIVQMLELVDSTSQSVKHPLPVVGTHDFSQLP